MRAYEQKRQQTRCTDALTLALWLAFVVSCDRSCDHTDLDYVQKEIRRMRFLLFPCIREMRAGSEGDETKKATATETRTETERRARAHKEQQLNDFAFNKLNYIQ